ncbi:hypothetical protein [Peptostreptococcus porci]|uniref:hypothetical protein n=1 Tax=Peptostreptococcus porci TaxID=2652282 RepID=UPI002A81FAB0|nr:hypothetical protein [Peptostreptococcus porci]
MLTVGKPNSSSNGSAVATTNGYWLVTNTGSATKVNGITGDIISITGIYPKDSSFGSAVATTNGYWIVDDMGNATKVSGIEF